MAVVNTGPGRLEWSGVTAGDMNRLVFRVMADGTPMDLTGCTVAAVARKRASDPAPAMTATVTVVNAAIGLVDVAWPGESVRDVLAGRDSWRGVWDMEIVSAGGQTTTVLAGTLVCEMDITRD